MKVVKRIALLSILCITVFPLPLNVFAQVNLMPQISGNGHTGATTASIPIEVPPGRTGLQPNIKLIYNSYGGNGWIGKGWAWEWVPSNGLLSEV